MYEASCLGGFLVVGVVVGVVVRELRWKSLVRGWDVLSCITLTLNVLPTLGKRTRRYFIVVDLLALHQGGEGGGCEEPER